MAHKNWLNDVAREFNHNRFSLHKENAQARHLRQLWIDKGLDRKMTFNEFLKTKTAHTKKLHDSNNGRQFTHGKYGGKYIGDIIKQDIDYIEWILINNPHGSIGKEIVAFFHKYPDFKI